MLPILEAYLNRLEELHDDLRQALARLPQAALDWSPGPEMNSLGVLAIHVAGAERFWVGDIAGGDPAPRDRPAEFRSHGMDGIALTTLLDASLAYTAATLERLTLPDLEVRRAAGDRGEVTVAWALFHNLQHVAIHLGQMQLTRQLWEQQHGSGS
jgi:uncharacterized damage-inducible protein DinB